METDNDFNVAAEGAEEVNEALDGKTIEAKAGSADAD